MSVKMTTPKDRELTDKDQAFTQMCLRGAETDQGPGFRTELQGMARKRLSSIGLPRAKDEEWRFVQLRPLTDTEFAPAEEVDAQVTDEMVASLRADEADGRTLVFVNGQYAPDLSDTDAFGDGVQVGQLSAPHDDDVERVGAELGGVAEVFEYDYFANLNTAGFRDGAYVIVDSDTAVDGPVHVLHVATESEEPYVAHPRNLFVVGDGSKLSIVEEYVGPDAGMYFNNPLTEVSVGEGATANHVIVQGESEDAFHINRRAIDMTDWSTYNSRAVSFGATFSRFDYRSRGDGEELDCTLDGLAVLDGDQVSDTHSVMDHRQGHSGSHQLHKMVLDDRAHSVFNGKIFVQPHAQKIDAYQLNRTLQLSRKSKVNTKPQLEIFADDVSCTHGATIGQLEDEQLFYLQARGIDEDRAREMLIFGFAAEILDPIGVESVRQRVADSIAAKTATRRTE